MLSGHVSAPMPPQPKRPSLRLVVQSGGVIELACHSGQAWLTRVRRQQIAQLVTDLAVDAPAESRVTIDGHRATMVRLQGATIAYLITVYTIPAEHPVNRLSPRQREIAEFAIAGATAREIAATLDLAHDTVRDHIKAIYRRLGVASRVELATLLRSHT